MGIAIAGIAIAVLSLWAAYAAYRVGDAAFRVAKQTLDLADRDWRQRKWFDLYAKGDEARDALERFQVVFQNEAIFMTTTEGAVHWNELMSIMRSVHTMAVVFPNCPEIDKLLASTAIFSKTNVAFQRDTLNKIADALEGIRQKCLIDVSVLEDRKGK